jgi:ubiquinol-cytochrome c reductase iron-sulfur subunit
LSDELSQDFSKYRRDPGAPSEGKAFTYTMVGMTGVFGAMATKSTVMDLLASLSASGDVLAQAQVEVDLSSIPEGKSVVLKWRGKPIFIRHRTEEEIEEARSIPLSELRDPEKDEERVQKAQWLVMVGICTHLGCVPIGESGDYGGWYCPCHGSHYDISGRVRKGPAPLNLEIPKYEFTDEDKIVIG